MFMMINRYTSPEMAAIWSEKNKFQTYLEVELACLQAYATLGVVPTSDYLRIKEQAFFDVQTIEKIETITKHDVIAFTRAISRSLGDEKKWFHYGLTSSDVVDSANSIRIKASNDLILTALDDMLLVLKNKAHQYQDTPCIGRTHGIHAEVMSFGLKFARWYDELQRTKAHFIDTRKEIEVIKLSGAVGNYANIDMDVETIAGQVLGLHQTAISTQVISRDRHEQYLFALNQIAQVVENMAMEVRHLSRSEIFEVSEAFDDGQKGSSAMPHKKNPIASENMCGCARMMRGYLQVAMENNLLWHERDISHSSNERIILSDAPILVHYMLTRYRQVLEELIVRPHKMMQNINLNGRVVFSGRVLSALINAGLARETAYDMIQPLAYQAMEEGIDFYLLLKKSQVMNHLTEATLDDCFKLDHYLKNTKRIYERVGI